MSDYYEKAQEALGKQFPSKWDLEYATAFGVLALVEELRAARKPIEISVGVVSVPEPVIDPRDRAFVPGDMVGATIPGDYWKDYDGRHGVVIYGPDTAGGWQVSFATGSLRCGPDELTMITRREDRTPEMDREAYNWKDRK